MTVEVDAPNEIQLALRELKNLVNMRPEKGKGSAVLESAITCVIEELLKHELLKTESLQKKPAQN